MNILHNPETLYELYQLTEQEDAPDLATVGMAMLRARHPEIPQEEDEAMRQFIGWHGQELAEAYPDKGAFYQAWAQGVADDIARAQEKEEEAGE